MIYQPDCHQYARLHTVSSYVVCLPPMCMTHCNEISSVAACQLSCQGSCNCQAQLECCQLGCTHATLQQVQASICWLGCSLLCTVAHCCLRCNLSAVQLFSPAPAHQLTCNISSYLVFCNTIFLHSCTCLAYIFDTQCLIDAAGLTWTIC